MFAVTLVVALVATLLKAVITGFGFVVGAVAAVKLAEKFNIRL